VTVLIKNGRIVTAVDDYHADIFINGSHVALIGKDLVIEADKRIDASGKLVIPGGVDPHTHLELPFGGTILLRPGRALRPMAAPPASSISPCKRAVPRR
jgi:dihydropyrimidinase